MFGRRKAPDTPFGHAADCRILKADPDVKIPWNDDGDGLWIAECVCGKQYHRVQPTDDRVRQDPRDPKTSRHGSGCEIAGETDPNRIRLALKVVPGADSSYDWVSCGVCEYSWPVSHYEAATTVDERKILRWSLSELPPGATGP